MNAKTRDLIVASSVWTLAAAGLLAGAAPAPAQPVQDADHADHAIPAAEPAAHQASTRLLVDKRIRIITSYQRVETA